MQNLNSKNWQKVKIGDLLKIKHGYAFKGEYFSDFGKYLLLTPGNFTEKNGLILKGDKEKYYTGEIPENFILKKGDLIIAMTDLKQNAPYLGAPAFIDGDDLYLHNQRLGLIQDLNTKIIDKSFLYWLFQSESFRSRVRGSATGSTVRHTAPERIYLIELFMPINIGEQRKIASILSAYDDLIENNNRRIKILEEMAQSIYKEWFVDFHFPGHEKVKFTDSSLGKIPEGWEINKVRDFGVVVTGKTPSKVKPEYYDSYMPFIKTPDMHGNMFCIETNESLSELGANSQRNKIISQNSICVSCIGTAGIVTITTQNSQTNQQINSLVLNSLYEREYLYFALKELKDTINSYGSNGATMINLNKSKFESLPLLKPVSLIVSKFNEVTCPIFDLIKNLQIKNINLKITRDLILPKLISGEIRA